MLPNAARWLVILLLLSGDLLVAQTPAAKKPVQAETVHVKAEPIPFDTLAGSYTSLDRAAIRASGARDTAELLRFVASVHFSQSGGKGSLSTISIRGGKPNFTMVLIDGVPANDIGDELGGAFNFATLDVDQIERIDIFRGPLSAIYGSEAISGVINIILRSPAEQPAFHLATEGGEFGYARTGAGMSGKVEGVGLAADGSYSRIGQQVFEDGSSLGTAMLAADREFGARRALDGFARWNRLSDETLPVSSGGPMYALSRLPEVDRADQITGGADFHQQVNPVWLYSVQGGVFSRVASDTSPAIFDQIPPGPNFVPGSASHTRFLRPEGETTQQLTPRRWLTSYTTLSLRDESGTSEGELGGYPDNYSLERTTFAFSEDADVHSGRGSAGAGFGVEKPTGYDTVVSPRAGGTLRLENYQFHASWGLGFNLPSFYSLGDPLVGNPALKPETSRGVDTGVARAFRSSGSEAALTYFDNVYHNLIDFSPSAFRLVNRNEAFARGSDLEVNQQWGRAVVGGSVTYVDAGLEGTTERLRDVPRWTEELHIRAPLPRAWALESSTVWVGRRFDYQVPVPQIDTVPRYTMTNLEATHTFARWSRRLEGYVRLENVFDSKFQEFVGFPNAGTDASAGCRYEWPKR